MPSIYVSALLLFTTAVSATETSAIRDYFYVGGNYVNTPAGHLFTNQMYVERLTPPNGTDKPYPLVFIHGQAQTGTNWLNKPDGSGGWASWFLQRGYEVYIIDQTSRARSAWNPYSNTSLAAYSAEFIQQHFTATQLYNLWPQASLHTQWPGNGTMGDPIFDEYYASNAQFVNSTIVQETTMRAAGIALLDKLPGPVILISHSQAGLYPWSWTDSRPQKVKAIVSIEPSGPPFQDVIIANGSNRPYGLTDVPLAYDPPVDTSSSSPLQTQVVPSNDSSLAGCIIQAEPARQLVNLKNVSVLVETGEASYHAVYDQCTVAFLQQAGVKVEHLLLANAGLHGNGHMQFLEKNSDDIAELLERWIATTANVA